MSLAPPAGPLLLAMRNLADRCRFPEWDPYAGQDDAASEYFAGFTPAPELDAQTLRARAWPAPRHRPPYFLACLPYTVNMAPRVVVVHHPFLYQTGPSTEMTDLNGCAYIMVGDTVGGQLPMLMEIPVGAFESTAPRGAPRLLLTDENLRLWFDDHPAEELITVGENWPLTLAEPIRVRRLVYLPREWVPLMIERPLSPKDAFTALSPLLAAREGSSAAEELREWLIATCHRDDDVSPPLTSVGVAIRPPNHPDLVAAALSILHQELPGLASGGQGMAVAGGGTLEALTQATHSVANAMNEMRTAAENPPTPPVKRAKDAYGQSLVPLLNVLRVPDDTMLPGIFDALAAVKKDQRIAVLESKFGAVASFLRVATPCVTKGVLELFTRAKVQCHDRNVLTDGLSPFLFLPLTREQRNRHEREARAYEDIVANGTVTMAEARQMTAEDTAPIPITSYTDLKSVLSGYYVCLFTFFEPFPGTDAHSIEDLMIEENNPHAMLWAYYQFWCELNQAEEEIGHLCEKPGRAFAMVRWIQLRAARYIHRQAMTPNLALQAPTFVDLLEQIGLEVPWMPTYVAAYAGYGAVPVVMAGQSRPPPAQGGAPTGGGGGSGGGGGGGGGARAERGVTVANLSPHAEFMGYGQVSQVAERNCSGGRAGRAPGAGYLAPPKHSLLSLVPPS
jgi:hypothetical protein